MQNPLPELPDHLWGEELPAKKPGESQWLWEGYLGAGMVTLLTGLWKAGKTTLIAALIRQMKNGGELAGLRVRPGKAMILSEESQEQWAQRAEKFGLGNQIAVLCRPFNGTPTPLQWEAALRRILEVHEQVGLDLVAFDPLAAMLPLNNENDATGAMRAMSSLQRLTQEKLSVLLLHHPRKEATAEGKQARGSGVFSGTADVLLELHWFARATHDDRRRTLYAWSRNDETTRQQVIEMTEDGLDYRCLGDYESASTAEQRELLHDLLMNAEDKLTRDQILAAWPPTTPAPSKLTLWRWLDQWPQEGTLLHHGKGTARDPYRYWLAEREAQWRKDPMRDFVLDMEENSERVIRDLDAQRTGETTE